MWIRYAGSLTLALLFSNCGIAQENTSAPATQDEAGKTRAITKGVDFLVANSAARNCNACHTSTFDDQLNFNAFVQDGSIGWSRTQTGVLAGKYVVSDLDDPILRGHLQLDDRAAVVVLQSMGKNDKSTVGAELEFGDVILTIDAAPVQSAMELKQQVDLNLSADLTLTCVRGGAEVTLEIQAADLAAPQAPFRIGVQAEPPGKALRSQLKLYENEGLLVTEVFEKSPADEAGIQVHDILLRAEGQRLSHVDNLRTIVGGCDGKTISLVIMRGGEEMSVEVTPRRDKTSTVAGSFQFCPACQSVLGARQQNSFNWFYAPSTIYSSDQERYLRAYTHPQFYFQGQEQATETNSKKPDQESTDQAQPGDDDTDRTDQ